ncbi:MAG TPA: antibiotic biosynthesis monooxygenase [Acetobacteraceae bacterium]|nr:antibiotic biosynthesis monooxygenase [Acetobacteraceae bacterium]
MFAIVRKFNLRRGSGPEVARRVNDSLVPLLRQLPGFRSYYLFAGGPDVLVSIRIFDSADEALASNELAAAWIRDNVLEFTRGMPEVMSGDVIVTDVESQMCGEVGS